MSHDAAPLSHPAAGQISVPARLPLTAGIVFGIAGIFLFLATLLTSVAAASVWAIGGYLDLGLTGFEILGVLLGVPTLYACWKILIMAIDAERDPANN